MQRFKRVLYSFVESLIRNVSGGAGQKIRYYYYKNKFKSCGENVNIGIGVVLQGVEFIDIESNVWIDDYCIIIAGTFENTKGREIKTLKNKSFNGREGYINIGSYVHFAPHCVIHGYGGVTIEDFVGFSSGVKLYSMSNHFNSFKDRGMITYNNPMVEGLPVALLKSPIVVKSNSFVSLNCIILMGTIGKDSFVYPMSIVLADIPNNSLAKGDPAKKIKDRFENYNE